MNGAPTPENFALGSLENDFRESVDRAIPPLIGVSPFERIINPLPVVPVMLRPSCGCESEETDLEEI